MVLVIFLIIFFHQVLILCPKLVSFFQMLTLLREICVTVNYEMSIIVRLMISGRYPGCVFL